MNRVTHILNEVLGEPVLYGSDEDRQFWLDRGSVVHKLTEFYDKGTLDMESVDERVRGRMEAWIKFRKESGGKMVAIERKVTHQRLNYTGTLDRILKGSSMFPTNSVLIDIKSGKPTERCALQTMAYKLAAETEKGRNAFRQLKRMSVELRNNGTYATEIYDDDQADQVGWIGCLYIMQWKERVGLINE